MRHWARNVSNAASQLRTENIFNGRNTILTVYNLMCNCLKYTDLFPTNCTIHTYIHTHFHSVQYCHSWNRHRATKRKTSCLYMFRAHVLIIRRSKLHYTSYMCDDTRGCVVQFWPPDDEHMCSKHVEAWNKLIVKQKFCSSSWLITEINIIYVTKHNICHET